MVPRGGRPRALDAGREPCPVVILIADQIRRARAKKDTDACQIDAGVEETGIRDGLVRCADADAVAPRPSPSLEWRQPAIHLAHRDFCGQPASVTLGIEQRGRSDAACARKHPSPRFIAARAKRCHQADADVTTFGPCVAF